MIKRRITALFLICLLTIGLSLSYANDELKRRERELEIINKQIEDLDASIDANKALQNETNQKIQALYRDVKKLEKDILTLNEDIKKTEGEIEEKKEAIKASEIKISDKNQLLNNRLRVMYKTGTVGYMEVLFGAEDFTDLLSRVEMVQLILRHDQNLLKEMKEARDALEVKKIGLEETKSLLKSYAEEKTDKQKKLTASLNRLVGYKETLQKDAAALKEMEKQAVEQADQLTVFIQNLKLADTYIGGEMVWPVPGYFDISSPFGERIHPITKVYSKHTGVDIVAAMGVPIAAAQTGTVVFADWFGTYGKAIIIDHGGGLTTLYGHCSEITVMVGNTVKKGDTIGLIGSTGYSTGPHLHFEVRENGDYVEPMNYLKK